MQLKEYIFLSLANILPFFGFFNRNRFKLLKLAGIEIKGKGIILGPLTVTPYTGVHNITIGDNFFLNTEIRFGCPNATIMIGDNVAIGPRCSFETTSHGLKYIEGKGRGSSYGNIVLENNVWIGANCVILKNVTIGEGAVVAAGSVVIKDVEPYSLVGGIPAKILKKISKK